MKKVLAGIMIFVAGLACGLVFTYGPLHAQSSINEADIMSKLNEISRSQEDIATAISSMKDDINLIKIRITQMQ